MDQLGLGQRINELLTQRNLKKTDLAEALEVDASAVTRILGGERKVSSIELTEIASLLRVSVLSLLEPDGPLAQLEGAARVSRDTPEPVREIILRGQSLAELSHVLAEGGILSPVPVAESEDVDLSAWESDAPALAKKTRQHLSVLSDLTIETLASSIESELGIDVLFESSPKGPLGFALRMPKFCLIFVNTSRPRRQQMFTLAHELGHVLTGDGHALLVDENFDGKAQGERFANAFAAELLMPEDEIRNQLSVIKLDAEVFLRMYLRFGTSVMALAYRLHNLGFINAFVRDQIISSSLSDIAEDLSDEELKKAIANEELNATHEYRAPKLLIDRARRGFESGIISVIPYADLAGLDPEEVLAENRAGKHGDIFAPQ